MEPSVEEAGADRQPWAEVDPTAPRSGLRPPTEEVRASLAAVRAAREAAQLRLQRDSRRTRLITMAFLAAVAAGSFSLAGHIRTARRQAREAAAAAAAAKATTNSTAPAITPSLHAGSAAAEAALTAAGTGAPSPSVSPSSVTGGVVSAIGDDLAWVGPEATAARARALAGCDDAYDRHRWRTAAEACGAAFEAQPHDPALAMKVAQAQHARSHYADAGDWARRAIALEGADPEAFLILAHAERRAKNPAAAKAAYRRYLALAPRGWHSAEARAALRLPPRL